MRLDYREYYYGGEYQEKSVDIPEESRIFDLQYSAVMHRVKDAPNEVYSRNYAILCNAIENYEDSELFNDLWDFYTFGDKMVIILNGVYIKEYESLENFPNEIFRGYVIKEPTPAYNRSLSVADVVNIISKNPFYCIYKIKGLCNMGFITDRIFLLDPFHLKKLVSIEEDYELEFRHTWEKEVEYDISTFNNTLTEIYNRILNETN